MNKSNLKEDTKEKVGVGGGNTNIRTVDGSFIIEIKLIKTRTKKICLIHIKCHFDYSKIFLFNSYIILKITNFHKQYIDDPFINRVVLFDD